MLYKYILVLTLLVGSANTLYSSEPHNADIRELIEKIKSAPISQRRVQMNALKMKLRSMNKESRRAIMMSFKKSFFKNKACHHGNKRGQNCKNKLHNKLPQDKKKGEHKHKNRPNKQHVPKF